MLGAWKESALKKLVTDEYLSTTSIGRAPPLQYDPSAANVEDAKSEFVDLLGEDGVNTRQGDRLARSSTEWSPAPAGACPCMIVYPRTTEDVSAIAKICHKRRLPLIAFGGGTSLEGTLAAIHHEVCIDFSQMSKIIKIHERDMDVVVQPGISHEILNTALGEYGLFFPPDPGPGAQIGGMIAQGCSGPNAYRYGTMKDWVIGLTIVLADGTIITTRRRPRKSSAGYDLTRLFVGSEGTLGLVTEATLRVTSKPENVQVAVAAFPSNKAAVDFAVEIVQKGMPLAAMELLDAFTMKAINQGGYTDRSWSEKPTLFLKFSGEDTKTLISRSRKIASKTCMSFEVAKNQEQADELWSARKTALWSLLAMKQNPEDSFLSADVAVPISRLSDVLELTRSRMDELGLVGSFLGHVGDGNFHTTVLYNAKDRKKAEKLIAETQRLGIELHGTITGEHGVGLDLRDMLEEELGVESIDAMRQIKLALDPLCLLNPDKMIRIKPKQNLTTIPTSEAFPTVTSQDEPSSTTTNR